MDAGYTVRSASGCDNCLSIRAETYMVNTIYISSECFAVFAGKGIPQTDASAISCSSSCESFPVWAECYAVDMIYMCREGLPECPRVGIPEANGPVKTSTYKRTSIWTEGYAFDAICMF